MRCGLLERYGNIEDDECIAFVIHHTSIHLIYTLLYSYSVSMLYTDIQLSIGTKIIDLG